MANFNLPTTTSTYSNFVTELDARLDDMVRMLSSANTTPTNVPTNAVRWNDGSFKFERWNGTAWADLAVTYGINISGTASGLTAGAIPTFGARAQVSNAASAMWEMHIPGVHARGLYLDSTGVTRLSTTNGAGVASGVLWTVDATGNFTGAADITATGNVTAYSDERLKANWRPLRPDFIEALARVRSGVYDRVDIQATQVGVSAQSLWSVMPQAVSKDAEGTLSVAYGSAALAACVELAKEVVSLRSQLNELKGA